MGVNTGSAAVHIAPGKISTFPSAVYAEPHTSVAFKTFYKHAKRKGQKLKNGVPRDEATDDVLFDEYAADDFLRLL